MIVVAAGKDIRAGQPHKGELCAVGAAADRFHLRLNIAIAHRLLGNVDNVRELRHFLAHIVITIFNHQFDIAIRVQPFAYLFGDLHHLTFTRFKR